MFKDFLDCRIVLVANHQYPGNIQRLCGQQKQSTVETSNSNQQNQRAIVQQAVSQQQAAIIQQAVFRPQPAIIQQSTEAINSSNQPQQPTAAINSINQQQQSTAAINNHNQQQQPAFVLPAAPTRSTLASVSYHNGS